MFNTLFVKSGNVVVLVVFKISCTQFSPTLGNHEFSTPCLTLKLAGYFATHIQAKGGGGVVDLPKNFETANN